MLIHPDRYDTFREAPFDALITRLPDDAPPSWGNRHPRLNTCPVPMPFMPALCGLATFIDEALKPSSWIWVTGSRGMLGALEASELLKGWKSTEIVHLRPPRRHGLTTGNHDRQTRTALKTHQNWVGYCRDGWLESPESWDRRLTSAIAEDFEGLIVDSKTFRARDLAAVLAPVDPVELRLGTEEPIKGAYGIDFLRALIQVSTPEGGDVFDPFAQFGSVGIAALLEDRDFIGLEVDEKKRERAKKRLMAWRESQKMVQPLVLQSLPEKIAKGRAGETTSVRFKTRQAILGKLRDRGANLSATIRAALQSWYGVPFEQVEQAMPPGSIGEEPWLFGKEKFVSATLDAGLSVLLADVDRQGYSVPDTVRSALRLYLSGSVEPGRPAPRK